jgi:uncharacterized Zn finger protein (UPF0148 family)
MTVVQRKAILKAEGFFPHKKNGKGTSIIYSRKHPTAKFVRVVVDSGIDSKTGKIVGKVGVKLCYINRQKQWREITTEVFTTNTGLVKTIQAQEAAEKFVKTCKHCKAKKFTAKSGNVVCANACWTNWSGKKKAASTTKKSSQKITAGKPQKKSQKKSAGKKQRNYPLNKNPSQEKVEKFVAKILPGDLVTIQEIIAGKMTQDFTGSVLGIVQDVEDHGYVKVHWTANTTEVEDYMLPRSNCYYMGNAIDYRLKVLSRPVEYAQVR